MIDKSEVKKLPHWAEPVVGMFPLVGSREMSVRPETDDFDPKAKILIHLRHETDFDLAAPYSYDISKYLGENGWREKTNDNPHYKSFNVHSVWSKTEDGQKVEVVLRYDHYNFMECWYNITPKFWYDFLWKSNPHRKCILKNVALTERKIMIRDIIDELYISHLKTLKMERIVDDIKSN